MEIILVAYDEIALKSPPVRRQLERQLARHIESVLTRRGYEGVSVSRRFGRLYVKGAPSEAADHIVNVFGIASVMPSLRTEADYPSIERLVVTVSSKRIGDDQSFAVRPKVVGEHSFSSQDLAIKLGSSILEGSRSRGVHVNLSKPDVTVYVEVRDRDAFVYTEIMKGFGGFPYGSQGKLVSLFSGGIDSPVATWLVMKRGAEVLLLLMDQRPYVGDSYIVRAEGAFKVLRKYVPYDEFSLYAAPMGDIMGKIMESRTPALRCVLCKRSMYRIASIFSENHGAQGVVTGESLGQVASQTLDNLNVLDRAVDVPVFRPLIGLDKVEIQRISRRMGAYEITSHSVEGCTVVPNRPTTRAKMDQVLDIEGELGLIDLCAEAAASIKETVRV